MKISAIEKLGDAYSASNNLEEAINAYERFELSVENPGSKLRALRKMVVCLYWRGDNQRALESAAKAKEFKQSDAIEYARLQLYKGFVSGRSFGNVAEAILDMEKALRVFEKENSFSDVAQALVELSFAYSWNNRLKDALSAALRSIVMFEELGNLGDLALAYNRLGTALGYAGFPKRGLVTYSKAIEIDEKIGDYRGLSMSHMMSGLFLETLGDVEAAVKESLQGVDAAEKTDAAYSKSLSYVNLVREYCKLGQVDTAEKYYYMLKQLLKENATLRKNDNTAIQVDLSEFFLLIFKGKFSQAQLKRRQIDRKYKNNLKTFPIFNSLGLIAVFEKMGQIEKAKEQRQIAEKLGKELQAQFEQSNVQAFLLIPKDANVGEAIEVRVDLTNIGRNNAKLGRFYNFLPSGLNLLEVPSDLKVKSSGSWLLHKEIEGLTAKTLKIKIVPTKSGQFILNQNLFTMTKLARLELLV